MLSRFVYDEGCLRDDGHPRKDIFIGPKSTRDISVDCHDVGVGINWYAGAAVKLDLLPVAAAEVSRKDIKLPLYVKPYSVPRMPLHADISGWLDAPGWGENKELAKELAKKAEWVRNPRAAADKYEIPRVSLVMNGLGDFDDVMPKFSSLAGVTRQDFECVCYIEDPLSPVAVAVNKLALRDRRIVMIEIDRSNAKAALMTLFCSKAGVRGEKVVFVGLADTIDNAMNRSNFGERGIVRSTLIEKVASLRFGKDGDIILS